MEYLIVVDMQKDFVTGALGTEEAKDVVPYVVEKVKNYPGKIVATLDTHREDYRSTQEGKNLPIPHCIKGTSGHELVDPLQELVKEKNILLIEKPGFGSMELAEYLKMENDREPIDKITFLGVCTDICVVSNALLVKAALPEVPIAVDPKGSAGLTPEKHEHALDVLASCQVEIL